MLEHASRRVLGTPGQNRLDLLDERRQFYRHDAPQDIEINLIVAMNKPIPCGHYLVPGNVRLKAARCQGNPAGRFTDDLDKFDQCKCKHSVAIEVLA